MNRIIILFCSILTLGIPAIPAHASSLAEPTKEELKANFRSREPKLQDLKLRGQLGETIDGYIAAVESKTAADQELAKLIEDENADRRRLYQMIADEINKEHPNEPVKATMETIAKRNAMRNIERAGADEYLRVAPDHWIPIREFPNYQKILKLKTQGKVGETASGRLEIVQDADRSDATLASTVEQENTRRIAEYTALATKEQVQVSEIEKRMGNRNLRNARIGDMIKDEGGAWRKK